MQYKGVNVPQVVSTDPRSSDKCKLFYDVLRKNKGFHCTDKHEEAFTELKQYMTTTPIFLKPVTGEILYVYLSVTEKAVSGVLVREDNNLQSHVYYVSKSLVDAKTKYSSLEKLVLALAVMSVKLRHYFEAHKIRVKMNYPLKMVLRKPELMGCLEK